MNISYHTLVENVGTISWITSLFSQRNDKNSGRFAIRILAAFLDIVLAESAIGLITILHRMLISQKCIPILGFFFFKEKTDLANIYLFFS